MELYIGWRFDEIVLRKLHSEQWVYELILFIIDQIQPDLWEEIAVCHAATAIQEGVRLGEVVDRYGTVHWMAKRGTVISNSIMFVPYGE